MAVPATSQYGSQALVTPTGADSVVIIDDSDGGALKTALLSGFSTALGLGTLSTQGASAVSISGGTLDGVTATNITISSGSINNTAIGATTRAAGNFTAVNVTNDVTAGGTISAVNFSGDGSALSGVVHADSWRGQWLTATAYVLGDEVFNDGASYICILAHTSGASTEPGTGASWTSFWDLRTSPGTGDVTGAASSVDNRLVRFDGASGDIIQNSVASLTDAGVLSGLTGLTIASGTINFTGATVSNGGAVTTIDINGGTLDNVIIGGAVPAAITGTTGVFTTSARVGLAGAVAGVLHVASNGEAIVNFSSDVDNNSADSDVGMFFRIDGDPGSIKMQMRYDQGLDLVTWGYGNNQHVAIGPAGSVIIGTAALATTATDGYLYIPTCAGTPTGVPTARTGRVAMIYDSSAQKFWIYSGAWRGVVLS